jgi:hypothetical protein
MPDQTKYIGEFGNFGVRLIANVAKYVHWHSVYCTYLQSIEQNVALHPFSENARIKILNGRGNFSAYVTYDSTHTFR